MGEEKSEVVPGSPEATFEPLVKLDIIKASNLEEDEEEVLKMRAKLYRYVVDLEDGPQWKERGVGEIKILKHKQDGRTRVIMRRDKTLKICANHHITGIMELKPHSSSEKAFIWNTMADYADGEAKQETLAIRLRAIEDAKSFKEKFEECVNGAKTTNSTEEALPDLLSGLKVEDGVEGNDKKKNDTEKTKEEPDTKKGQKVDTDSKKENDKNEVKGGDAKDDKTECSPSKSPDTSTKVET